MLKRNYYLQGEPRRLICKRLKSKIESHLFRMNNQVPRGKLRLPKSAIPLDVETQPTAESNFQNSLGSHFVNHNEKQFRKLSLS